MRSTRRTDPRRQTYGHWTAPQRRANHRSRRSSHSTLYPSLYRLKRQGLITNQWGVSENNRRARYYTLTAKGRQRLGVERQEWQRLSEAVNRVLATRSV